MGAYYLFACVGGVSQAPSKTVEKVTGANIMLQHMDMTIWKHHLSSPF